MSIRVFFSSTRYDLDPDCRPGALIAVTEAQAVPVEMDRWDTDYNEASFANIVALCGTMIQESSHYLGVFAYRRGWGAPPPGKSITEVEFDWALGARRTMAVFVPNPAATFTVQLRERARKQSEEEAQAQEAFLKRVAACGTFMLFEDPNTLIARVNRKVLIWVLGGMRAVAGAGAGPSPAGRPRPNEGDIFGLGRRRHLGAFEETLEMLAGRAPPRLACFLAHGPGGHGHDVLTARLRRKLDDTARVPPKHVIVHLDVPWRGKGLDALLAFLARELSLDAVPDSVAALARGLEGVLTASDVLLEIRRAQWFDGSLPRLVQGFWRPLVAALHKPLPHRLIGLVTVVQDLSDEWQGLLQGPPTGDSDPRDFDPGSVIRLPRLDHFTQQEVALWLRRWLPEPEGVAQQLIVETDGHPLTLYNRLTDDALWAL